ncbi:MAG: ADP-ribose pyrophosphatase [Candidatus Altiarchaeales archaeon ex4484_2]|nr:MAG: ADP-ribose pyrophosphatase [Candidatus Altiarchaeales archaeon ex4484_2]
MSLKKYSGEIPLLTVDAVILEDNRIVLVRRRNPPFKGMWALPGGFVDYGERVEDAVEREAKEETSLVVEHGKLLGVYSKQDRDPRGHTVSVVFACRRVSGKLKASSDAAEAGWFPLDDLPELAFDHKRIIDDII